MILREVKLLKGSKAREAADEAGSGSSNGSNAWKQPGPGANRRWVVERKDRTGSGSGW